MDSPYGNPAYTLELSPGISNDAPAAGGVPEPSSSIMFGIGIGLAGLLRRRA